MLAKRPPDSRRLQEGAVGVERLEGGRGQSMSRHRSSASAWVATDRDTNRVRSCLHHAQST